MIKLINITIWGRDFPNLKVEYDCYSGETITQTQIEALERFLSNPQWIIKAQKSAEKFCKSEVNKDKSNEKKDNIFSYIKPEYIYVKRDEKKQCIALMCKYRYDIENGLAIVFDMNGNIMVGPQDIIL